MSGQNFNFPQFEFNGELWFENTGVMPRMFPQMLVDARFRDGSIARAVDRKNLRWKFATDLANSAFQEKNDIMYWRLSGEGSEVQTVNYDNIDATMEKSNPARPVELRGHDILEQMANTFRERNAVYGDNYKMVGKLMEILHPDGVVLRTAADHDVFHLWSLVIVKLSRFAISGLKHVDSIHDQSVYGAMIEAAIRNQENQK